MCDANRRAVHSYSGILHGMGNKAGKKVVDLISSATPRGNRGVEAAGTSDSARFYKSNGLYATCAWDERVVRKMIADKKLAPRYPGVGKPEDGHEECPICFLVRLCVMCRASARSGRGGKGDSAGRVEGGDLFEKRKDR